MLYRKVLDGILYILRSGCLWEKILPSKYGSGSTFHRRFQQWIEIQLATVDQSGNCCYVVLLSLDVVHYYSNNDGNY